MFKRKVYDKLLYWKNELAPRYACLLEGARRVGKTTIAEEFAKNEYDTYIKIDFSDLTEELENIMKDINNRDLFFLRLQQATNKLLIEHKSVIIFDEVQLYPKARQAIKHLVADGRYDYIETGSLISINKNVKDILIPSEEHKIQVYPMDYEEFLWAINSKDTVSIIEKTLKANVSIGNEANRISMRRFRLYMAIGGMPQAIETYLETNNLSKVDETKREIINLYYDDIRKIDDSGRMSDIFNSIPSQLALKKNRFVISSATGKQKTNKDEERLFDLINAKIVLPCYNVRNPNVALSQTRDSEAFKLYLCDIGLFTTMIFNSENEANKEIYNKLLSDSLSADLGYMYENVVAQMIVSSGRSLYYHTWKKDNSTHSYEIDFLLTHNSKIIPIEVKSSGTSKHKSINAFCEKYSNIVGRRFLFSQKDFGNDGMLELKPIYTFPFVINDL